VRECPDRDSRSARARDRELRLDRACADVVPGRGTVILIAGRVDADGNATFHGRNNARASCRADLMAGHLDGQRRPAFTRRRPNFDRCLRIFRTARECDQKEPRKRSVTTPRKGSFTLPPTSDAGAGKDDC
jgi:hypothetical protein